MGADARDRIAEIRRRNNGGNMEGIPGFDLYSDQKATQNGDTKASSRPEKNQHAEKASTAPVSSPKTSDVVRFPHTAKRHEAYIQKNRQYDAVREQAAARADHRALRARDGAVLRLPYKVNLKSRASG